MEKVNIDGEYFFLRKRIFKVLRDKNTNKITSIGRWQVNLFKMDNNTKSLEGIPVYKSPKDIPSEYLLPYISFLEMKLYRHLSE